MTYNELEDLKELITHKLDVLEFLDLLGCDIYDLVNAFEDEIKENEFELRAACR